MALSFERKKEILLETIDGLRKKVVDHMIGDMMIEANEKITPVHATGSAGPVKILSEGFRYTIDVTYLDPSYTDVPDSKEAEEP